MARSFKVYQGEDATPVYDLTEPTSPVHVIWEEVEAGGRAFKGESTTSSIPVRDERGETGSSASLPVELSALSLSHGSRIEWLDGPDGSEVRLFRGRIGTKDYSRGRQKADRAREVVIQAPDTNQDLHKILVEDWVRGEETDVTRVTALVTTYLQGNPRASTNIATTYISSSNPVTLPARTYDGTSPGDILNEIASFANKLLFVTVDDELFYDGNDSTVYRAGVRISDRIGEINTEGACTSGPPMLAATGSIQTNNSQDYLPVVVDGANPALYVITFTNKFIGTPTSVNWLPDFMDAGNPGVTEEAFINIGSVEIQDDGTTETHFTLWRLVGMTPSTQPGRGAIRINNVRIAGFWSLTGVNQSDPEDTVATNSGTNASGSTLTITADADDFVLNAGGWAQFSAFTFDLPAPEAGQTGDWDEILIDSVGTYSYAAGGGHGDTTPAWDFTNTYGHWGAIGVAVNGIGLGGATLTFPPIWDVGPSSTEDGIGQLSGIRLYYGQAGDYVYVTDPTVAAEYWHAEESLYTDDPAINDATKATALANAIIDRRKTEERTYNVSIGPLSREQIGCIKPGQLIDIKARAIPDADDAFVSRRIAQLRWTTPHPTQFYARMQLNRPLRDAPHGIGPKSSMEEVAKHAAGGAETHPTLVARSVLTTQGDLPYRGASDWTRLPIGANGKILTVALGVPSWGDGLTNPMTTAGDIITGGASGAAQRLGIGSAGQVLTVVSGAPAWAAGGGGGSGGPILAIDYDAQQASYGSGDAFAGTTLDGGWSNLQSTALTTVDASREGYLVLGNSTAVGNDPTRGVKRAFSPAGDFMVWTRCESVRPATGNNFYGPSVFFGDSAPSDPSGNRAWVMLFGSTNVLNVQFAKTLVGSKTLVLSQSLADLPFKMASVVEGKLYPYWLALRRVGTAVSCGISMDGVIWEWHATTTTIAFTVATCGLSILHQGNPDPSTVVFDYIATDDI